MPKERKINPPEQIDEQCRTLAEAAKALGYKVWIRELNNGWWRGIFIQLNDDEPIAYLAPDETIHEVNRFIDPEPGDKELPLINIGAADYGCWTYSRYHPHRIRYIIERARMATLIERDCGDEVYLSQSIECGKISDREGEVKEWITH
jgi:hypothetical protein